ncbi:MAG: polymer-forming cytoskeletal protein [Candidatus Eisenbacteria bacterium]
MFRNTKETTKVEAPTPARPQRSSAPGSQETTQVATGAGLSGKVHTTGNLVVNGRIEGSVRAEGDVEVGASGVVEAEVEGRNVTVAGRVKGRIYAEGKVVLVSGSHVEGDIHAQSLKIEDSVFFQGGCVMGESARREKGTTTPLPKSVEGLEAA